jgi:hypothetical protein
VLTSASSWPWRPTTASTNRRGGRFVRDLDAVPFEASRVGGGLPAQFVEFRLQPISHDYDSAFGQELGTDRADSTSGAIRVASLSFVVSRASSATRPSRRFAPAR